MPPFYLYALIAFSQLQQPPTQWELSGSVKDSRGPVRGVFVILAGPGQVIPMKTDANGSFHFRGDVSGLYTLRVQKKDNTAEPRSRAFRLMSGQQVANVELQIPSAAILSGRVIDENKRGASRLTVLALRKVIRDGRLVLEMKGGDRTNDKGDYRITSLPEGTYLVAVLPATGVVHKVNGKALKEVAVDGLPPMTFAPQDRNVDSASRYVLHAGEDRQAVDILVRKEPTNCLTFLPTGAIDDSRFPSAAYATVKEWIGTEVQVIAEGPIEGGQTYEVCGLTRGEYRLHLHSFSTDRKKGIGYLRATAHMSRQALDLGQLSLRGTVPLEGKVEFKDAKPGDPLPPGIQLNLTPTDRGILISDVRQAKVGSLGEISSSGIYVDAYRLSIEGMPPASYVVAANQNGVDSIVSGVRPGDGPLLVTLSASGGILTGSVTDEKDGPVSDASVFLIPGSGSRTLITESDQSGSYRFENQLPPGDYSIIAITGLSESQRTDLSAVSALIGNGKAIRLAEREVKALNLKVQKLP